MANAIVTIGALMFVAGLGSIVYGARIIQVEEGWASVIAGSTLIAGGMVTLALGLVIRLLRQLKTTLGERPVTEAFEAPEATIPMGTAPSLSDFSPVDETRTPRVATVEELLPAVASEKEKTEVAADEPVISAPPAPTPAVRKASPVQVAPAASEETLSAPEPAKAHEPPEHQEDMEVHPADDFKLDTPSSRGHDFSRAELPPQTARSEPIKPSKEADWLDQALAQIDEELPIRAPGRQNDAPSSNDIPSPEIAAKPTKPTLPKAVAPPAKVETKPPETAPSAVIGRYEADGTSYVMYADGSIEAQSESGVFRFASMAELRAYIEG